MYSPKVLKVMIQLYDIVKSIFSEVPIVRILAEVNFLIFITFSRSTILGVREIRYLWRKILRRYQ